MGKMITIFETIEARVEHIGKREAMPYGQAGPDVDNRLADGLETLAACHKSADLLLREHA